MVRLFVDMDGVLAEFKEISKIETLYEKSYFENLKPQQGVVDAINEISQRSDVEVNILSSYLTDSKFALAEKQKWINKYLRNIPMGNRIFVPYGQSKLDVLREVDKNDFLLDDYTKNLLQWQEKGIGIKLLNGINHTHKTWTEAMVSINDIALADSLLEIMGLERSRHFSLRYEPIEDLEMEL